MLGKNSTRLLKSYFKHWKRHLIKQFHVNTLGERNSKRWLLSVFRRWRLFCLRHFRIHTATLSLLPPPTMWIRRLPAFLVNGAKSWEIVWCFRECVHRRTLLVHSAATGSRQRNRWGGTSNVGLDARFDVVVELHRLSNLRITFGYYRLWLAYSKEASKRKAQRRRQMLAFRQLMGNLGHKQKARVIFNAWREWTYTVSGGRAH
jgi:hypothetical protein